MIKVAILFLTLLLLGNIPSLYYGWYLQFMWVDTFQHFLGGFFVAMLMTGYLKDRLFKGEWIKNTLIIAGATIFIGVIWEFVEYIANQTLIDYFYEKFNMRVYFMGDLKDTVNDLLMDTLGALVLFILHSFRRSESHQIEAIAKNNGNRPT